MLPCLVLLNLAASWSTISVTGGDWLQVSYWLVTACCFATLTLLSSFELLTKARIAFVTATAMAATCVGATWLLFSSDYLATATNSMFVALFAYLPLLYIYCFLLLPGQVALRFCVAIWAVFAGLTLYFGLPALSVEQQGASDLLVFTFIGQPMAIFLIRMLPRLESELEDSETQRLRAEHDAITDALTQLSNRRGHDNALAEYWRQAEQANHACLLVMIDIDHFKDYNDALGHPEGDRCLRQIGHKLSSFGRQHGLHAARVGGEEFALIGLIEGDMRAQLIAEQAKACFHALSIEHPRPDIAGPIVTASVGYATLAPRQHNIRQLTINADTALYKAKREGRNRAATIDSLVA
jgi:diguanylate cyclase (GGDEF)-like protein